VFEEDVAELEQLMALAVRDGGAGVRMVRAIIMLGRGRELQQL
jgi:hypothetical protein